ncbi:MAG: hypothetical protein BWY87_01678 [Deltaproteobacteria bacterium ADurb.Bin510]|nr:MAG: hypothetical protein BWY87_01678 [Deltaproteobacteria bacterium ADurb.Bin510]
MQALVLGQAQAQALDQAQRDTGALLHDVAHLAGQDHLLAAVDQGRFDEQDLAAKRRPGQAGGDARQAGALSGLGREALGAQNLGDEVAVDLGRAFLAARHPGGHHPQHGCDLALQVAHAGFAGVGANQAFQGRIAEVGRDATQAIGLEFLGQQVVARDRELVFLGVAVDFDDLEPVAQGRRDVVDHVGRGDEEDLREVIGHVQVVIHERVVLFGVEGFEQRRGRVAVHVLAELVDFVQHEDRVYRAGLLDAADDAARHGADVGAAVAADLGLVAHAAQ